MERGLLDNWIILVMSQCNLLLIWVIQTKGSNEQKIRLFTFATKCTKYIPNVLINIFSKCKGKTLHLRRQVRIWLECRLIWHLRGKKINWKKIKQPEDSFLKSLNYKDIKLLLVNNSMYKQISGILTHYMLVFKSGRVKHRASLWNAF